MEAVEYDFHSYGFHRGHHVCIHHRVGKAFNPMEIYIVVNAVNLISCEFSVSKGELGIEKWPTYILFSEWTIGLGWCR